MLVTKNEILTKIEILVKNKNVGQKIKNFAKNPSQKKIAEYAKLF